VNRDNINMKQAKVIVLTGATRGLGRALVPHFIAAGHVVLGCGTNKSLIEEMSRTFTRPHYFRTVDVLNDIDVANWAQRVIVQYGPPDLLINNAAIVNTPAPLWQVTAEEFDRVVGINIIGVANVIRAFVPSMVARKSGVIVNLSSGWGRSTSPEVAPYCATKYAIEGMTKALAQELPSGMAAIPLNPGIIDTDMLRQCWSHGASAYPKAEAWAERAAPYMLSFSAKDNGKSLSVLG
jgi:NAD(P)-dependent dehydrogenase (short-subunit alcohol dehydrogenase family)